MTFFYHRSMMIQHLVSDRRLSLISKENVHNVKEDVVYLCPGFEQAHNCGGVKPLNGI